MSEKPMQYIEGHLGKNLSRWKGKEWYHQRFDGAPYFMHFVAEAETARHAERKKGGDFTVHFCFYDEGKADWYILMDDIKKVTNAVIKASKKDPQIGKTFIKTWKKDQEVFYKTCLEVGKINLSKLNNAELIKLHDKFAEITLNKYSSSSLIDGFALGTDELIAKQIQAVYDKSELKSTTRFTEIFSVLTAPIHLSFINEAEIALLELALKLEEKGHREFILKNSPTDVLKKFNKTPEGKLISAHQKKYFWTRNNYVTDNVLTEEYFVEELKNIYYANLDLAHEIEKISNTPVVSKKKKKELFKKFDLSEETKTLLTISEDFTYWQDERKRSTFWATHYFSLFLIEIAKRSGQDIENLKYMTCREISKIFEKSPSAQELVDRKKNGVYYWDKEGMEAVHSKESDFVREAVLGTKDLSDVDDFRGLTASLGRAVGPAKIVRSATEINKINKGDILVAVMTRPDYVPAMKKAAAIVTDEGGITCHAAIVSRELGVPCIIGTKIATKVIKENDTVEVNANHGWVRILKRNN